MVVYGYSRLVGYDQNFNIVPDLLESIDVKDERVFTMKLRSGHRWSDGQPFTVEDFRYFWEDVANNKELSPTGPPSDQLSCQPPTSTRSPARTGARALTWTSFTKVPLVEPRSWIVVGGPSRSTV